MSIQKTYNIIAKKSLGQNFLKDESILDQILAASHITGKHVIEVWPWYGALSEKIVQKSPSNFDMLELDSRLVAVLKDRIEKENWHQYTKDIQIYAWDVLDFYDVPEYKYHIIANIPYYITSPILRHFLYNQKNIAETLTILMQKDVADKIIKQFHHKKAKSSVIWLLLAKKMHIKKVCDVPAEAFDPIPKVQSSVLHFEKHTFFTDIDDQLYTEFIKKAFCEPRKKMLSNLVKNSYEKNMLEKVFWSKNISLQARAEDLSVDDFCELVSQLHQ